MAQESEAHARAEVTLERLRTGKLSTMTDTDLKRYLLTTLQLIQGNQIDFGGASGTWEAVRALTDLLLQKLRELTTSRAQFETLRGGLHRPSMTESIEDFFDLPLGAFPNLNTLNVGAVAAAVIRVHAPQLITIIPTGYLPDALPSSEPGGISESELRRIIREETRQRPPPKLPRIEFNPAVLPKFPTEEAPVPPPPPAITPEQATPANPAFPTIEQLSTYGGRELQALFRAWARLTKGEVYPPRDVLEAARARWVSVFKFPAPGD